MEVSLFLHTTDFFIYYLKGADVCDKRKRKRNRKKKLP